MSHARPFDRIRALYADVSDYFLPPGIKSDREATNQARMFLVSHIFGPPLGLSVPLALFVFDPTPGYEIAVLAVSIFAFWAFPFLLRQELSYRLLVLLSILNLNFSILWSCFHYGGVHSPTVTWVLIIPILAVFYIGGDAAQKRGLAITALASVGIFGAAYAGLDPGPNDIPAAAMEVLGATSAVAVMAYVAVMAIYYARIFDAGVDLENEVARRRLMAIELRRAVEAAGRAASAKSEFLARMSHELRSPLNAIIGYGELLREEGQDNGAQIVLHDVDRILEAGAYLTRLIDMILDLAKIDSGKMTFDSRPHDLGALIEAVVERRRAMIQAQRNRVVVDVSPDLGIAIIDANRFGQILDSILKNAATHTEHGRIEVTAVPATAVGRPAFRMRVSDTGSGIPAEILPVIFESFLMERGAAEGRYGGTGLALSVTSKLCQAMGGEITAQSVEGEGSVFTVTLPLAAADAKPAAAVELARAA